MNTKKYLLSVIAVFFFLSLFGWLYHGMLLKNLYMATQQYWRPEAEMMKLMHFIYLGHILFALLFCFIYTKGLEPGKSGLGQGFRYGLWIGLLLHLPMTVIHHTYLPYPKHLLVAWLVGGIFETTASGMLVGSIYKKEG